MLCCAPAGGFRFRSPWFGWNWPRAWTCRRGALRFRGISSSRCAWPGARGVRAPFWAKPRSRKALAERREPYQRRIGLVDDYDMPLGLYLQAASPREIIARMLRNLKEVHRMQRDW